MAEARTRERAAPPATGSWRTRANALSALRLAGAGPLAWAAAAGEAGLALGLFAAAVASDLLDGRVARRFGEESPLGGLLDHGADAATVCLGLGALAWRGEVPALLPALIAVAFVQYALDSRAFSGQRLRASSLGRANGIAYFALLGALLARDALALPAPGPAVASALAHLLAALTLLSIATRALSRKGSDPAV